MKRQITITKVRKKFTRYTSYKECTSIISTKLSKFKKKSNLKMGNIYEETFYQRGYTNGIYTNVKFLNIIKLHNVKTQ